MFLSLIKPSEFDYIPHWDEDNKKLMAGALFNLCKRYKTIPMEDKRSIAHLVIWRRYCELKTDLVPDNNLFGNIRKEIYRTIENEIELKETAESYLVNLSDGYDSSSEESKIDCLTLEKILLSKLKKELESIDIKESDVNLLDDNFKDNFLTLIEAGRFDDEKNRRRLIRFKNKLKEEYELAI